MTFCGIKLVIVHVEKLLDRLSSSTPSNSKILKVDDHVRSVNEKAYDPEILAIGPIHHNKDNVKDMEQHKVKYLHQLLQRRHETSVENYVIELRKLEEQAHQCYTKSIQLDCDEFVEMLLLDGLFIIELVRRYWFDNLKDKNDYIFQSDQMLGQLRHDLLLFENQLPFFILNHLFEMTKMEDPDDNLHNLIIFFVGDMFPWHDPKVDSRFHVDKVDHLLGLVYKICFSFISLFEDSKRNTRNYQDGDLDDINSTSELKEAGIQLKRAKGSNLSNLRFRDGVIEIPLLKISDKTESLLRNLIAYEQILSSDCPKYVTDYAFFMHCLVNSRKDVEILRRSGIISNWIGDDETVYIMFNRLGKNVLRSSEFCYSDVFLSVNRHCRLRHNTWIANLKQNYFNSPWAFVSFLAAVLLILLTSTQTVFTVLSYGKGNRN